MFYREEKKQKLEEKKLEQEKKEQEKERLKEEKEQEKQRQKEEKEQEKQRLKDEKEQEKQKAELEKVLGCFKNFFIYFTMSYCSCVSQEITDNFFVFQLQVTQKQKSLFHNFFTKKESDMVRNMIVVQYTWRIYLYSSA